MFSLRVIASGALTTPTAPFTALGAAPRLVAQLGLGARWVDSITFSRPWASWTAHSPVGVEHRCWRLDAAARANVASVAPATAKHRPSRLFGTKRGIPGNPPGEISVYNEQTTLPDLDIARIERTLSDIRDIIGYPTYDVSLILTEDEEMRETNRETRGIDAPTDILSFPFQDSVNGPGDLCEPEFDIPDYYNLGDMMLDVPYVLRRIEEDRRTNECRADDVREDGDPAQQLDDAVGQEDGYVGEDDRGVSGAMATEYDPEARIRMLLVHGMLHLVGYDHIEEDYEVMVTREEEVLKLLGERTRRD